MSSKFVVLFIILTTTLTACGSSTKPKSLAGTWKSSDPSMVAIVDHGGIRINIVDGDTSALYWKGTFAADQTDDVIVSQADRRALNASMFGSEDSTKTFAVVNGKLTFKFRIMGTTSTVYLER